MDRFHQLLMIFALSFFSWRVCSMRHDLDRVIAELETLEEPPAATSAAAMRQCSEKIWGQPAWFNDMNCEGVLWSALTLSASNTPKERPNLKESIKNETNNAEDSEAVVHFPFKNSFWRKLGRKLREGSPHPGFEGYRLHGRYGAKQGVAVIWRPKTEFGQNQENIYIGFQSARPGQLHKILQYHQRTSQILEEYEWNIGNTTSTIKIHKHAGRKAEKLWGKEVGLGDALKSIVLEGGKKHFIFCGISHGAALAQIIGLRFELERKAWLKEPESLFQASFILSWNAYRWTDDEGAKLVQQTNGQNGVHLIQAYSEEDCTILSADAVPGFFGAKLANYPNRVLLDQNGLLLKCETPDCPPSASRFHLTSLTRVLEHHQTWYTKPPLAMLFVYCGNILGAIAAEKKETPSFQMSNVLEAEFNHVGAEGKQAIFSTSVWQE